MGEQGLDAIGEQNFFIPGRDLLSNLPIGDRANVLRRLASSLSAEMAKEPPSRQAIEASIQFEKTGMWDQPLPDGFIFAATYNSDGSPRISYDDSGQTVILTQPEGEFTYVDPKVDSILAGSLSILRGIGGIGELTALERICLIARITARSFNAITGSIKGVIKEMLAVGEATSADRRKVLLKIGDVRRLGSGVCRQRAVWAKVLNDSIGAQSTLVRVTGSQKSGKDGHCFVLYRDGPKGNLYYVDPMDDTTEFPVFKEVPPSSPGENSYRLIAGGESGAIYYREQDIRVELPNGETHYFSNSPVFPNQN